MSKKNRDYIFYLEDMAVNLQHAIEYIEGMSFESFCKDSKTQDATVRCLEITGEAAHTIPNEIKLRYPGVEWDDLYAFRIKVAHHYFDIDQSLVWQILKQHVPSTLKELKKIIAAENGKES
jgi:uncharacterized protein with HEPN domain